MIVFDDMIDDMLSIKKLNPIAVEICMRFSKPNMSLVFITQSFFDVARNFTPYVIMKVPNKRELQQITFNHLSDIDFQGFMNL